MRHKPPVSPPGEGASTGGSSPLGIVTRGEGGSGKVSREKGAGGGTHLTPPVMTGQSSPSQHWGLREGPGGCCPWRWATALQGDLLRLGQRLGRNWWNWEGGDGRGAAPAPCCVSGQGHRMEFLGVQGEELGSVVPVVPFHL